MSHRKLHQPDINGTHTQVDHPLPVKAQAVFKAWMNAGNLFAPNTSYTIEKIARNINYLANSPYIVELGVGAYESDADTPVIYHALNAAERDQIASVVERQGEETMTMSAFYPKHERGDTHGMYVYISPEVDEPGREKLLSRHFAVEEITTKATRFAEWVRTSKKPYGMVEWKPAGSEMPLALGGMNVSNDSGGTYFVTPSGVNKATTFLELLDLRYPELTSDDISIAGDSGPTDGPLFNIPGITHIAVGDDSLLKDIPGRNLFAQTPDEANELLKQLLVPHVRSAAGE